MNKYQIGVIGNWETDFSSPIYDHARIIGEEIAKRGHNLVCGGSTGVMQSAMLGCRLRGGQTIAILPCEDHTKYSWLGEGISIYVNTGLGEHGRMSIIINSSRGLIVVGGQSGTLAETTLAYNVEKPIVILRGCDGIPEQLESLVDSEGFLTRDRRKKSRILFADEPVQAVDLLIQEIEKNYGRVHDTS